MWILSDVSDHVAGQLTVAAWLPHEWEQLAHDV